MHSEVDAPDVNFSGAEGSVIFKYFPLEIRGKLLPDSLPSGLILKFGRSLKIPRTLQRIYS